MRKPLVLLALMSTAAVASPHAWGAQGHRLVGLIAADRLTPAARDNVRWLLDGQTLAEVASWADSITSEQQQTAGWHYLNIPPDAAGYDRDRDCPRQPGVAKGSRADRWRDCIVDRIGYWEQRLADHELDRADRATALKFVVHFIGDLHQPFHALGVGRGGNDVRVRVFGNANCAPADAPKPSPCNLHSVWDSRLIGHRNLNDREYAGALRQLIVNKRWGNQPPGTPAQWAEQSWRLAKEALVTPNTNIDDGYYRRHITVVDERMALAGVRLAAVLNRVLVARPNR
jgi:nuclease S1